MSFRCLQIADITIRNDLEKVIIATASQYAVCKPSADWLGNYAYPGEVRPTGLWNAQHTGSRPITADDLHRFESLAEADW
jgi:hypothetical protein